MLRELFRRSAVFSEFPDDLLTQLQQVSHVVQYMPDQNILVQGELNHNLFFLLLGTVDIFVDGGLVATLSRKGDLLGEMSVITKKPCAATIVAKTPVQLVCIDTEKFRTMTQQNQDQFEHILFRIYSLILTDKLHVTNQKAKQLENTLDALTRAKLELQEINKTMEARVAERTASLKTRMEQLLVKHLNPLRVSMKNVVGKIAEGDRPLFQGSLDEVDGVIRMLEPITTSFSIETSIKNKKVLVADVEKKQQLTAKMALGGTGVKLETVTGVTEGEAKLSGDDFDLVLADAEHLPLLAMAKQRRPDTQLVFVTSDPIQDYLPKLQAAAMMPNIVSRDDEDRALTIKNITTTVTKLASHNIFGLEKYLNWGVDVQELPIKRSDERISLREKMAEYFVGMGVRKSILDNVDVVAEELLMNAIYDAPMDVNGRSLFNKLSRQEIVMLKPEQQGRFRFASDGTYAAISVEDPFGGLTADTVLNYLDSCYGGRAGELNKDKGGAGRGLHQIIENSTLVVFNVAPKKRTEVVALFYILPGDKRERVPQFHYFSA